MPQKPPENNEDADALKTGSSAPNVVLRTLEQSIGAQIKRHRKLLGLTVAELAGTACISNGMLSKIENGQISPSLTTLQVVAKVLNIPLTTLFSAFEEQRDCSYVPVGHGVTIDRRGTKVGHQYQLLGHSLAGDIVVEPYLITLTEDAVPYTSFQHEGSEFIYMLSGNVIYAHADRTYELRPGDSMSRTPDAPR